MSQPADETAARVYELAVALQDEQKRAAAYYPMTLSSNRLFDALKSLLGDAEESWYTFLLPSGAVLLVGLEQETGPYIGEHPLYAAPERITELRTQKEEETAP